MIGPVAVSVVVKATVLLAVAGVVSLVLRRRSAAARHLVWTLALAGVLAVPAIELGGPRVSVPAPWVGEASAGGPMVALPADDQEGRSAAAATDSRLLPDASIGESVADAERIGRGRESDAASPADRGLGGRAYATGAAGVARIVGAAAASVPAIWLAGVLIVLLWLGVGQVGLARLARRGHPLRGQDARLAEQAASALGVRRRVRLLSSAGVSTPLAFGALRPVVVLPVGAGAWPAARRRSALLHELAHVARRDALTQLIAGIACALYWFHPAVWLAARALRAERERACDDRVLEVGTPGSEYAEHLLQVARASRVSPVGSLVAVSMARPGQLEGRLLAALDGRPRRGLGRATTAAVSAASLLLILGLGALRPVRAQSRAAPAEEAAPASPQPGPMPALGATSASAVPDLPDPPALPRRQDAVIQARVAAKPGERILLDLRTGGSVRIRPWEKDSAWVKATVGERDARQTHVTIGRDDGGVVVRSVYTGSEDVQQTQHHFEVRVPRRFDVDIHSDGGAIDIDGLEGTISGRSGGGELTLTHLNGQIDLSTGGGTVLVKDSHLSGKVSTGGGGVKLKGVSGNLQGYSGSGGVVKAESAKGDGSIHVIDKPGGAITVASAPNGAVLSTGGGDVVVGPSAGAVSVRSGGGSIRLGPVSGSATAITGAGDVTVTVVGAGPHSVEVRSGKGLVTLNLPEGLDARLDLETGYTESLGHATHINSDIPLQIEKTDRWDDSKGTPRKYVRGQAVLGKGGGLIRVRTTNGDIVVRRRTSAGADASAGVGSAVSAGPGAGSAVSADGTGTASATIVSAGSGATISADAASGTSGFAYVTGDSPEARREAVEELAKNAPPAAAVAALERIARQDPDPTVRKAAIDGLRRIGTPEAAKALERITKGH